MNTAGDAMERRVLRFAAILCALCVSLPAAAGSDKPLVVFVGDSVTAGRPTGREDYVPSDAAVPSGLAAGSYGYVEALVEGTLSTDVPYRFQKLGSGGQALTGWIGICCRRILGKRDRVVKELPALLVVQDNYYPPDDEAKQKLRDTLGELAGLAATAGVRLAWCTVGIEPGGTFVRKTKLSDVDAVNELFMEEGKKHSVPVIRLDIAWKRYLERFKDRQPARDWWLTRHGKLFDGAHPGRVGAYFQALVFARELGIPPEKFDQTAPALAMEKSQADEIKAFVYSWKDPTVLALENVRQPAKGEKP
jgi:hypothetical protein